MSMPFSQPTSHFSSKVGTVVVIGAGRMGSLHLGALSRAEHWQLTGVFDRHPAHSTATDDDLVTWLAERKPQAAIVAVPPQAHEAVARACMEAGCHVLLEKPLCPSGRCARELAADFFARGLVLFGGHTERFNPIFQALLSHQDRIGSLVSIQAWRMGPKPERCDAGGVVMDLAIHDLDLVQRLGSGRVSVHSATCGNNDGCAMEVRAMLHMDAVPVEIQAQWCESRRRGIRLTGEVGILEADLLARNLSFRTESGVTEIDLEWSDPLESEHAAFAASCRGEFDAKPDLEPQIRAVELAEAILSEATLADHFLQ